MYFVNAKAFAILNLLASRSLLLDGNTVEKKKAWKHFHLYGNKFFISYPPPISDNSLTPAGQFYSQRDSIFLLAGRYNVYAIFSLFGSKKLISHHSVSLRSMTSPLKIDEIPTWITFNWNRLWTFGRRYGVGPRQGDNVSSSECSVSTFGRSYSMWLFFIWADCPL